MRSQDGLCEDFLKKYHPREAFEKARKIRVPSIGDGERDAVFHILFEKDWLMMQMGLVHPKVIC
ncbi:hypothetical protein OHAE_1293 [Ochrobactrum soli]|uniref:Uncharacterized protein n=1 Tax=Ochrobactrum soli TaxID=2448455 RepID=A0A2P9HMU5_9HYPH|nr:hypothetical protein OHAE_1293 [[Ochrobactrum] soli]